MSRHAHALFMLAATLVASAVSAGAPADRPIDIGSPAPDFRLPGVDGKTYGLNDFRQADVLVIVFTCNHCPTAQAYEERIAKLAGDYKEKKVALVAVSPNDPAAVRLDELGYTDVGDSLEDMKIRARDRGFPFPYLYDGQDQKFSRACGAMATPHAFIFDRQRHLRYAGRIDNSEHADRVTSHDARTVIDALLEGKPVPVERTRVFGCSVKWADKRDSARKAQEAAAKEKANLSPLDEKGFDAFAKNNSGKLRLIHVWAPGTTGQLADLATMNQMYRRRDFELITVCPAPADQKDKVLQTLQEKQVTGTNHLLDGSVSERLKALDKASDGTLPHTMLIEPGGKILFSKTGTFDALEVRKAIVGYIGRTYP